MATKTAIQHYVTKFLTEDWESSDSQNKRELHFFDVQASAMMRPVPASRLLGERKLWNAATECRLNALVETPLSAGSFHLVGTKTTRWEAYRAMILLFALQPARADVSLGGSPLDFETTMGWPDAKLNELVRAYERGNQFLRLVIPDSIHPMFYPSTGYFAVPIEDPGCATGWSYGWIIPVRRRVALALVSNTVDGDALQHLVSTTEILAISSVGSEAGFEERIVVPPELVADERLLLSQHIPAIRSQCASLRTQVHEARELLRRAYSMVGVGLRVASACTDKMVADV